MHELHAEKPSALFETTREVSERSPRSALLAVPPLFQFLQQAKQIREKLEEALAVKCQLPASHRTPRSGAGWRAQSNSDQIFGTFLFCCPKRQVFTAALSATHRDEIISRIKHPDMWNVFIAGDWSPSGLLYFPVSMVRTFNGKSSRLPSLFIKLLITFMTEHRTHWPWSLPFDHW